MDQTPPRSDSNRSDSNRTDTSRPVPGRRDPDTVPTVQLPEGAVPETHELEEVKLLAKRCYTNGGKIPKDGILTIGQTFEKCFDGRPRYEVVKLLMTGGMAYTYVVKDHEEDDHLKVLKVAMLPQTSDPTEFKRIRDAFKKETRACNRVHGDRIAHFYTDSYQDIEIQTSYGPAQALMHIYLMELYEGGDLRSWMGSNLTPCYELPDRATVFRMLADICSGVARIHEKKFAHADIKPENVLFDLDRRAYVADLGLSLHREDEGRKSKILIGTPGYLSPEQLVRGGAGNESDDVYALGCIAYELLSRQFPTERFSGDFAKTNEATMAAADSIKLPEESREHFGEEACRFVERMLRTAPFRPSSAECAEFFQKLDGLAKSGATHVHRTTDMGGKLSRRTKVTAVLDSADVADMHGKGRLEHYPDGSLRLRDRPLLGCLNLPFSAAKQVVRRVGELLTRIGS